MPAMGHNPSAESMKRLVSVLLIIASLPAEGQVRLRPMGDVQLGGILISFEASSYDLFAVAAKRKRGPEATCTMGPSAAFRWADSTERLILQQVNAPKAPDRIIYIGP